LSQFEVPVEKLRWDCVPEQFKFQCTSELTPLAEFIGQDRAIKAMEFGLAIDQPGSATLMAAIRKALSTIWWTSDSEI